MERELGGWDGVDEMILVVLQILLEYSCFSAKNCLPHFPRKVCKDISAKEVYCAYGVSPGCMLVVEDQDCVDIQVQSGQTQVMMPYGIRYNGQLDLH